MQKHLLQFEHYLTIERGFSLKTAAAYRHDLNKFAEFLHTIDKTDIQSIAKDDIRRFLSELASKGFKKPNGKITVARKLSAIKSFFRYLVRENALNSNPASDIESPKLPQKEPSYLNLSEYQALLAAVSRISTPYYFARDLAIITTFLGTGIRLSELVGLTLNSLNLQPQQETITVRGKGDKERIIPLNKEVVAALQKYLKVRPDIGVNHIFISRLGNKLCSGSVYYLIKRCLKEAGIRKEGVGVHSLRHTFGASLLNNGVNLVVIQELLGHKKLETTRRYLHINNIDLRNAVDKLVLAPKK